MITNNFENTGTNKKVKLELTWTWTTVIQELKDERNISNQFSWGLIILTLIELDKIPIEYLKQIIEFVTKKVLFNQTNSASKSVGTLKNNNSLTVQMIFFRISHQLCFYKTSHLIKDINLITKTAHFFLKHFNKDQSSVNIMHDIVQSYQNLDITYFKVGIKLQ